MWGRRNFRESTITCGCCHQRTARVCQSRNKKTKEWGPIQKPPKWKWITKSKLICPDCAEKEEEK